MKRAYFLKISPTCDNNCFFCHHLDKKSNKFKSLRDIAEELNFAKKSGLDSVRLSCNAEKRDDLEEILQLIKKNNFISILETAAKKFADINFLRKIDPFVDHYELYLNFFDPFFRQDVNISKKDYDKFLAGFFNIAKFTQGKKLITPKVVISGKRENIYAIFRIIDKLSQTGQSRLKRLRLIIPFRLNREDEYCLPPLIFFPRGIAIVREYAREKGVEILANDYLEFNPLISQEDHLSLLNTENLKLKLEVKKYKNKPRFSVIIPTLNRKNSLKLVINSFLNQAYPKSKYEIIVIDDGSKDKTFEVIKKIKPPCNFKYFYWPREEIKLKSNFKEWARFYNRAGPARNIGIKYAQGEIILFNDDDVLVPPNCLKEHEKYHNMYPNIIVRGFRMLVPASFNFNQQKFINFISLDKLAKPERRLELAKELCRMYNLSKEGWQRVVTANLSIRKNYLDLAGGFSGDFIFWGSEDVDLGYRLRRFKMKFLWDNKIKVYHLEHPREFGGRLNELVTFWLGTNFLYRKYLDEEIINIFKEVILIKLDDMISIKK